LQFQFTTDAGFNRGNLTTDYADDTDQKVVLNRKERIELKEEQGSGTEIQRRQGILTTDYADNTDGTGNINP